LAQSELFSKFMRNFDERREAEMSLEDYLTGCRKEPLMYATAPERLLAAIGKPELVDTAQDSRLGRIFMNRTLRTYPSFAGF